MSKNYKTTFVIPTYNRSKEFIANYSYFVTQKDSANIKIILVDGSSKEDDTKANKDFCEKNNFDYYYVSFENPRDNTFYHKALYGLQKVQTSTAKLCDDEDVYSVEAVLKCVEFLENNEGYSSASGHYKLCKTLDHKLTVRNFHEGKSLEQDDPLARLWSLLFFYNGATFFSIYKTEILLEMLKKATECFTQNADILSEQVMVAVGSLMGKYKRLDVNYCARLANPFNIRQDISAISVYVEPLKAWDSLSSSTRTDELTTANLCLSISDSVNILKSLLIKYIEPIDNIKNDILTIILANFFSSAILWERTLYFYNDYIKDNDFDMSLIKFIDDKYSMEADVYMNYTLDISFTGSVSIYGAGTSGEFIFNNISATHKVDCFIDKNHDIIKEHCGLSVIAPQDVNRLKSDNIIIANDMVENEIFEMLLSYGIEEEKIVRLSDIIKNSSIYTHKDYFDLSFGLRS